MLASAKCGTLLTQDQLIPNSRFDVSKDPKKVKLTRGFEQRWLSYLGFTPSLRSQLIVGTIPGLAPHLEKALDLDIFPPGPQVY